jgi:prepilin signal peptidase PulO-like enzyme (type II secretory pathway)
VATLYNLSNVTNATNVFSQATALNAMSNGVLGATIVVVGYFITFIGMKDWGNLQAFSSATFGWTVMTLLLFIGGFVTEWLLMLFMVLSAVAGGFLITQR